MDLKQQLQTLTDAEIADLVGLIDAERAARIAARNEGLPEFPSVIPVDGHQMPVEVSRDKAVELLATGKFKLAE